MYIHVPACLLQQQVVLKEAVAARAHCKMVVFEILCLLLKLPMLARVLQTCMAMSPSEGETDCTW
jgi:hypothetical protein